ncbi:MAG: O-antigen ligase family protein [Patulibacter sp.]
MIDNPPRARCGGSVESAWMSGLPTMRNAPLYLAPALAVGAGMAIGSGYATRAAAVAVGVVGLWGSLRVAAWISVERVAIVVTCLALALTPCNGLRVGPLTAGDIGLLLAIPAVFVLSGFRFRMPPTWFLVGVGVLLLSVIVSELSPPISKSNELFQSRNLSTGEANSSPSWVLGLRLVFAVAAVPTIVFCAARRDDLRRKLAMAWLAGTFVSALVGVLAAWGIVDLQETLTGVAYGTTGWRGAAGRFTGLAVHPTQYGVMAAIALPIALTRMTTTRMVALYGPVTAILFVATLVSGSRAALAGAFVAVGLAAFANRRTRQWIGRLTLVGAMVAVVAGGSALATSFSSVQRLLGGAGNGVAARSAGTSDTDRARVIREGVNFFFQRPVFGWTYGAIRGAHDIPLQLLSSGGILALLGWMTAVCGSMVAAWRVRRSVPDGFAWSIAIGVLLVAGLSMNAILDRWLYVPTGFALAAAFAGQRAAAVGGSSARALAPERVIG